MANSEELQKQVEQYESDQKNGVKKKKKGTWKYILNISFVLIVTAVSIVLSLWGHTDTILANLAKCDLKWILVIIGIMLVIIVVRSFILFCFARLYTRNYHVHQAVAVDQIGVFYNAVTPGASGGQIMQAYTYKKQGLHISSAVSALAMYSIVFQIVLIIYGILAFVMKFDLIMSIDPLKIQIAEMKISIPPLVLTIAGFILNISVILIVLLMSYWHGFHNFIMGPIIGFLSKLKIVKKPDKTRENLRIQVENFKIEFRRLMTNIPFFILVAVSFAVYMTVKYSVPYFCGLALGNEHTELKYFWDSVFLGNYHQMITGLIPLPGSAGISEYFFAKLFYNESNPRDGF
nr:flippase-like domain-containing protein [Bacilli bacterium]